MSRKIAPHRGKRKRLPSGWTVRNPTAGDETAVPVERGGASAGLIAPSLCGWAVGGEDLMHKTSVLALLLMLATTALAQTQMEQAGDACATYQRADATLNAIYHQVLVVRKDQPQFIAQFKEAQRAWLKFRDAHLESIFPAPDKPGEYGSSFSMCRCVELAALTTQRVTQLQQWLAHNEGDVCAGSRL